MVEHRLTDTFIADQLSAIKPDDLRFGVNVKSALAVPMQLLFAICLMMSALFTLAAVAPAQPPRMTGGMRQGAQGGSRLIPLPAAAHP